MKKLLTKPGLLSLGTALGTALGLVLVLGGCSQSAEAPPAAAAPPAASPAASDGLVLRGEAVEVACGACVYHMPGVKQCTLAARINGTPMLVTGDDLDPHAHGLCSAPAEAVVSGTVEGDTLAVTSLELE